MTGMRPFWKHTVPMATVDVTTNKPLEDEQRHHGEKGKVLRLG